MSGSVKIMLPARSTAPAIRPRLPLRSTTSVQPRGPQATSTPRQGVRVSRQLPTPPTTTHGERIKAREPSGAVKPKHTTSFTPPRSTDPQSSPAHTPLSVLGYRTPSSVSLPRFRVKILSVSKETVVARRSSRIPVWKGSNIGNNEGLCCPTCGARTFAQRRLDIDRDPSSLPLASASQTKSPSPSVFVVPSLKPGVEGPFDSSTDNQASSAPLTHLGTPLVSTMPDMPVIDVEENQPENPVSVTSLAHQATAHIVPEKPIQPTSSLWSTQSTVPVLRPEVVAQLAVLDELRLFCEKRKLKSGSRREADSIVKTFSTTEEDEVLGEASMPEVLLQGDVLLETAIEGGMVTKEETRGGSAAVASSDSSSAGKQVWQVALKARGEHAIF